MNLQNMPTTHARHRTRYRELGGGRRLSALCALVACGLPLSGITPARAQTKLAADAKTMTTNQVGTTGSVGQLAADNTIVEPRTPARSGSLQTVTPPGPEADAGCSVPTLSMCQDQSYLETECGQLQLENAWTCSVLIPQEFSASASVIAYEISPTGVSKVIPGGSAESFAEYAADPGSLGSGYVSAEHGGFVPGLTPKAGNLQALDPYEAWASGTDFRSCQEYVYERFYEVHEFLRELGSDARDSYRVLEVAFGPEALASSFGTHHLHDLTVHALNGDETSMLHYGDEAKNTYFWLPPHLSTSEIVDPGPGLHDSLRIYSGLADMLLDAIEEARAIDDPGSSHYLESVYPQTLEYDQWWWRKALYDGYEPPGGHVGVASDLMFNPESSGSDPVVPAAKLAIPDDGIYTPVELLGLVPGYPAMRRYLRAELDELYEVQARVKALAKRWGELNWSYIDSGWDPNQIAGEGPGTHTSVDVLVTPTETDPHVPGYTVPLPVGHPDPNGFNDYTAIDISPPPGDEIQPEPRSTPRGGGSTGFAVPDTSETAQRRAILAELVELMRAGSVAGCLKPGITPCDWSPREFRQRVLRSLTREREAAYTTCQHVVDSIWQGTDQAPTDGLMMNMLGKTYAYNESNGCSVTVPSTLTAAGLSSIKAGILACREAQAQVAEDTALAEIEAVSDLYDAATGEYRNPGFWKTGGERMGNDWFAVGYDYDFGWQLDLDAGVCSADARAGAHFDAYVDLLKKFSIHKEVKLIDVTGRLDTDASNGGTLFKLSAKVLDSEIFPGIEVSDSDDPDSELSFSIAREASEGIEAGASVPFVIVFVPVTIGGGVAAELGVRSTISGQAVGFGDDEQCPQITLTGELEPFARARGFVSAAVELGVARAGIRGELTILEASFPFSPSFALATDLEADVAAGAAVADLKLIVETKAAMRLSTLDGEINAFAEVGWPPIGVRGSITLIDWNGPSWEQPLYKNTYELPLATLSYAYGDG